MMQTDDALPRLLAAGRHDDAERLCRARLQSNPADAEALGVLLPRLLQRREMLQARSYAETAVTVQHDLPALWLMLGQVRERMQDRTAACIAFAEAAKLDEGDWVALLLLGDCHERNGDAHHALSARVQALHRAERSGALAPDARLPPPLHARLQHAIPLVQQARASHLDAAVAPLLQTHGAAALARVVAALDTLVGRRAYQQPHPLQHPTLFCMPDLPPQPWFDRALFPFLDELERETDAIRAELLALLDDEAVLDNDSLFTAYVDMPDQAPAAPMWRELNRSPRWRGYHFYRHGIPVAAHHARCPRTAAALQRLPLMHVPDHAPEAMFSLLAPHTAIPPHTGVINGRLTAHLPLIVPANCGALGVGGESREWQEGRCLIFDDTFVHEAWNDSDHLRVVLIFDVWHPALSAPEREGISAVIAALGDFNQRHGAGSPLSEAH